MVEINKPAQRIRSAFCLALALFLLLNLCLNALDCITPFSQAARAAERFDYDGTERKVERQASAPKVILLGSSLTLYPMWAVDKKFDIGVSDSNHYHHAKGLDKELLLRGQEAPQTYDLAVGGAFISDSYLLLKHYLKSHPSPQFVILDCAPRSFYDSAPRRAASTPIFDFCFQLSDFLDLQDQFLPDFTGKVDFLFSRLVFMYHHRQWLSQMKPLELRQCFSNWLISLQGMIEARSPDDVPGNSRPAQNFVNQSSITSNSLLLNPAFRNSIEEYKGRYFWINESQLKTQMGFLKLIARLCTAHRSKLIVVNMPLTEANRKLLPSGFYDHFVRQVGETLGSDVLFLDLAAEPGWSSDCYMDSVHLNDTGGARYNKILAETIARQLK